ncbi:MAG: tetratricopeptide repeat protein, partial [Bryobacterales bacterium]|nr:tetratricopeptide repeat protein [Bryobacterales bacterium]
LNDLGRLDEALTSLNKALELAPNNAWAWAVRGLLLGQAERLEEALNSFDEAVAHNPSHTWAWANRGVAQSKLERYKDALASFDKLTELDPKYAWAWAHRGWALDRLGRYEGALASFDKAAELDDQLVYARIASAEIRTALGRTKEAGAIVATLVATNLSTEASSYLVDCLDRLASGRHSAYSRSEWLRIWKEAAGDRDDYRVALRMLEKGILYLNTGDRAALLALPAEERSIVAPLVGWTESDEE